MTTYTIRPYTLLSNKQYQKLANSDMKQFLNHRPCENADAPRFINFSILSSIIIVAYRRLQPANDVIKLHFNPMLPMIG